jgi:hypothetical protein
MRDARVLRATEIRQSQQWIAEKRPVITLKIISLPQDAR